MTAPTCADPQHIDEGPHGSSSCVAITEPGVYDLDEAVYHADPVPGGSLSCSAAKKLLAPSCPAVFAHERENGQSPRSVFDFGHAAHTAVLGIGAPVVVIDADDWRGKAAREQRDAAYAAGHTPVLVKEAEQVDGMAAALRAHPIAAALLDPAHGKPEQSLFRIEPRHGLWLRSRLDWMPTPDPGGHLILADYKTTASAEPAAIAKAVASFGYHQQHAWYADMVTGLDLAETVSFGFIFQQKIAPYLVTVVELDDRAVQVGRERNDEALDTYVRCTELGVWPGYADDRIVRVSLPAWADR